MNETGVFYSLRPKDSLDRPEEISGAALEGFVAQHLRTWNAYSNNPYKLYFWRSRGGVEVDFIIYGENNIIAIEVKKLPSYQTRRPSFTCGISQ